jgi:peptidyl-prolyl cis-trans isomerase A (cyclophilin A)
MPHRGLLVAAALSCLAGLACATEDDGPGSTGSSTSSTTSADDTQTGVATTSSGSTGAAAARVVMVTDLGSMVFEIYEAEAPITAGNFLQYVDEDRFGAATFYRTVTLANQPDDEVKIEVIQGGLAGDDSNALPPLEHETTDETGIVHLDGTLSMARATVGTATSEFFVCIGDQPELDFGGARNPDGQGFAAFGRLVQGADIAGMIHQQPEMDQYLSIPVVITSIDRQ